MTCDLVRQNGLRLISPGSVNFAMPKRWAPVCPGLTLHAFYPKKYDTIRDTQADMKFFLRHIFIFPISLRIGVRPRISCGHFPGRGARMQAEKRKIIFLLSFCSLFVLKLDSSHIEFVLDCMQENTTKVRNIKQYLKAVLFNAPSFFF